MDCIICRYGELALKGKNRGLFEKRLVDNIRACLKQNNIDSALKRLRGRIIIFTKQEKALDALRNVFGLVSISPAVIAESDVEDIKAKTGAYAKQVLAEARHLGPIRTFRITTRRPDKRFKTSSHEMDIILGDLVGDGFNLKADMKDPDLNIGVEIHDNTFIFHEKLDCFGGLPLGISGNVVCIIEDKKDIAAAWLVMRRGCIVFPVSFSDAVSEKVISPLRRFSYGADLELTRLNDMSEIDGFAENKKCKAVVIGADLEGFDPGRYRSVASTILKPLIGYDAAQIDSLLRRIS